MNEKICAALAGLLLAGMALEVRANFVPGQGPHSRNPTVSMDFNQPWGFITNFPRSTMHVGGGANPPLAYSTNKYMSPFPPWSHELDGVGGVNTNVFNWLVEDGWRGCPADMGWTTSPAIGGGALRLATAVDISGIYTSKNDSLSYNMLPAVISNDTWFAASKKASIIARVYVPDPSTWQPAAYPSAYPFLLMSMVGDPGDWPAIWCQCTNGTDYSWACDENPLGGSYTVNDYTVYPHMKITGPGWWTVGASMDEDGGVNYYVRSGLVTLSAGDYCGSYRPVVNTKCYGLFGTFYIGNTSATMSPDWIVDEVDYFHRPPTIARGTVILIM